VTLIRFIFSCALTTSLAIGIVGCSSATETTKPVAGRTATTASPTVSSAMVTATTPKTAAGFAEYVQGLKAEAKSRGYQDALIAEVFASLTFHPKVVVADKGQPEFVETLDTYLPKRVDAYRIKSARAMYKKHAVELAAVSKKYGVPARFIVSLWGLESAFGKVTGGYSVPSALATLAYDGRREQMFRKEFFIAMDILAEQHISLKKMKGSWAGAMGHTQFMPSAFMKYAQDGDGDGHKDIWTNSSDAMASIANYLKMEGWHAGQSWGRQVRLPANFDYSLVIPKGSKDRAQWLQWWQKSERSLSQWQALGLTTVDGKPLPRADLRAALVMPDDKDGRAYLAYANYQVLMHWNRSYYFVSSVGYLADTLVATE
jgi:membrane-bound lytic murein transglycosylase B